MSASPSEEASERLTTKDMLEMTSALSARWVKRYTAGAIARTLVIDTISRAVLAGNTKPEVEKVISELETSLKEMSKFQRRAARVTNLLRRGEALLTKLEQRK